MPERKRHIVVAGFSSVEDFRSRKRGRNPESPSHDRVAHGQGLSVQYSGVLQHFDSRSAHRVNAITEDLGIYVEITGVPGYELPLDSLDTIRDFKLHACKKINDREVALVFIPESKRTTFQRKLEQYLDPTKDRKKGPANHKLVDSIAQIRVANLKSFWTDDPALFPENPQQVCWWELWLKKRSEDDNPLEIANQLAARINAQLGNTSLTFFDSVVVLIKASTSQLEQSIDLISNLEELRPAKETPDVLIQSSPQDQHEWVENLTRRVQLTPNATTSICILDTGVNYDHPLLSLVCNQGQSDTWQPSWPRYDTYDPINHGTYNDHGSKQAGLATFGDLHNRLVDDDSVVVNFRIESGRIFPPTGANDPELYGAITIGTVAKLETDHPDWRRVYSLAITAEPERDGGQPSSWSAEIDQFTSGIEDGEQRLFVISAGNNRKITATPDYWEQVHLAQIEDPAQSWNAMVVGAYTEKTTNDDPTFEGWSPFAISGDVSPTTCSAVNWGWRKHAPYKPDIVAEGGNCLLSPNRTEVTDADVVSLLTTSGRSSGQLFETTAETSAACALVSRQAGMLMAEYPEYWPETIRGLLIHSAEWTDRMFERFGLLQGQHSPKVAKETMLKTVGYGVPDLNRAMYSASHALTLIAQDELHPFTKNRGATNSADPKLNEMQLYQLPWPIEVLQQLPSELEVKLRITLSYFIEPNPGRRGYRQRYSYQSHGLRFEVIRPGQSVENLRAFVNALSNDEDYEGPEGDNEGWRLGPQLRTRGSLHSDIWTGPAANLAAMHTIAVYPVGGWWKYRTGRDRWQNAVRYSLIVSIDVPDENIDIYSVIENLVETQIDIST